MSLEHNPWPEIFMLHIKRKSRTKVTKRKGGKNFHENLFQFFRFGTKVEHNNGDFLTSREIKALSIALHVKHFPHMVNTQSVSAVLFHLSYELNSTQSTKNVSLRTCRLGQHTVSMKYRKQALRLVPSKTLVRKRK